MVKLTRDNFQLKFPLHCNKELGDYSMYRLIQLWDNIDFDVFLPTKGINLQRQYVWNEIQQSELILSILKGNYIPPLTIIQHNEELGSFSDEKLTLKLIDGKQRVITLKKFIDGEFSFEYKGQNYFYKDLDDSLQKAIFRYPFRSNVYYEYTSKEGNNVLASDQDLINLFCQINFAGTPQDITHFNQLNDE